MARAIRAVSSGTGGIACGCNDIGSLLAVYIFYFSPVSHISLLPIRQQYHYPVKREGVIEKASIHWHTVAYANMYRADGRVEAILPE
jgi:hypothetical protein